MNITESAQAAIHEISQIGAFRIQVFGNMVCGSHVDLFPNSQSTDSDVIICDEPEIVSDVFSFNQLVNQSIDFENDEFIISNRAKT